MLNETVSLGRKLNHMMSQKEWELQHQSDLGLNPSSAIDFSELQFPLLLAQGRLSVSERAVTKNKPQHRRRCPARGRHVVDAQEMLFSSLNDYKRLRNDVLAAFILKY